LVGENNMKEYRITFKNEIYSYVDIEAENQEEAWEIGETIADNTYKGEIKVAHNQTVNSDLEEQDSEGWEVSETEEC
tara:strand:- start:327 stop:557 length:231 start_codon:yes stop_codon:yes gene_type:complete